MAEVTDRLELDAAWEAHRVVRDELDTARRELEGHRRYSDRLYPRAAGYDRLKHVLDGWKSGIWELEAALERMTEIIKVTDENISEVMAKQAKPAREE